RELGVRTVLRRSGLLLSFVRGHLHERQRMHANRSERSADEKILRVPTDRGALGVQFRILRRMTRARGSFSLLGLSLFASACAVRSAGDEEVPYLTDREYRRAELERSLESRDNGYARLRLAHYATNLPDDWDTLPEWNPSVSPVEEGDIGAPRPSVLGGGR